MKSNIEFAPKEYWVDKITYNDAVLYCFALDVDGRSKWRLPTNEERCLHYELSRSWYAGDEYQDIGIVYSAIPVRDIT